MAAIEPAMAILPVMSQLIANVSSVPRVRQLMAFRTDLACVSAPRNECTRPASVLGDHRTYHADAGAGLLFRGHDLRLLAVERLLKLIDLTDQSLIGNAGIRGLVPLKSRGSKYVDSIGAGDAARG
jgi:hypothetical protein